MKINRQLKGEITMKLSQLAMSCCFYYSSLAARWRNR